MFYPEFLEFIGRLAILKFLGSELEEEPLAVKIGYILDEMFSTIKLERVMVDRDAFDVMSDSDDDY